MGNRMSPSALITKGLNALPVIANLDPRDRRTKNFKMAVTRRLGTDNPSEDDKILTLGTLTGSQGMDWDKQFVKRLKPELAKEVDRVIDQSLLLCDGDTNIATTHALTQYVTPIIGTVSQAQSDEVIRRVVNGIVERD